jgi:hypothetical protein
VRVGALAGALAIAGSTMLLNILIYLIAPAVADARTGIRGFDPILRDSGGLASVLLVILDSILFGIAWGIVYGIDDGQLATQWKNWRRGLAFATLPLLLAMLVQTLVVMQVKQSASVWLALGVGEAIRWGAYGVLIGLTYPVLRARRLQARPDGVPPAVRNSYSSRGSSAADA